MVFLKAPLFTYLICLLLTHLMGFIVITLIINDFLASRKKTRRSIFESSICTGLVLFLGFCGISLIMFLFGLKQLYSVFYGIGLVCLSYAILKSLFDDAVDGYKYKITTDAYKKMAYTDPMCNIGNRNAFYEEQKRTSGLDELCYIMFDINNLKNTNDTDGHAAGDMTIQITSELIHKVFSYSCSSYSCHCFRIGGDEFAVICTTNDEEFIKLRLQALDEEIEEHNFSSDNKVSVSYGYAIRKGLNETEDELLHRADLEMYRNKKAFNSAFQTQTEQ